MLDWLPHLEIHESGIWHILTVCGPLVDFAIGVRHGGASSEAPLSCCLTIWFSEGWSGISCVGQVAHDTFQPFDHVVVATRLGSGRIRSSRSINSWWCFFCSRRPSCVVCCASCKRMMRCDTSCLNSLAVGPPFVIRGLRKSVVS